MIVKLLKKNEDLLKRELDNLEDKYGSDKISIKGIDKHFVTLEVAVTSEQEEDEIYKVKDNLFYKTIIETLEKQFGKDKVNIIGFVHSEVLLSIKE